MVLWDFPIVIPIQVRQLYSTLPWSVAITYSAKIQYLVFLFGVSLGAVLISLELSLFAYTCLISWNVVIQYLVLGAI